MWYKYIVKNVARKYGKTATFMPKPIFGDNGSGMHIHQSIWKGEKPLFAGSGYAGMSEMAMHYIAGIIKHAPALAGVHQPDHQQLPPAGAGLRGAGQPGVLEPQPLGRHPHPDVLAEPEGEAHRGALPGSGLQRLLAFSAMLMAGLDGIENRLAPGDPLDKDIYSLTPEELKGVAGMPASLEEALDNLKKDHAFLLKGDVFTEDVIETWIDYKMANEVSAAAPAPASVRVLPLLRRLIGSTDPAETAGAGQRAGRSFCWLQRGRR